MALALVMGLKAACPLYSCVSMPDNQCGNRLSSSQIQITDTGCASGQECTLSGLLTWVDGTSQSYLCTTTRSSSSVEAEWTYAPCLAYRDLQSWKSGGTVLMCSQDSDCLKADSSYALGSCLCVPRSDGRGICSPDSSNKEVFGDYWNLCEAENGRLEDLDEYNYWSYAFTYWAYMQTDLNCTQSLTEVQTYMSLQEEYSGAGVLMWLAVQLLG